MFYVLFFVMLIGRMAMANQRIVIEPQTVYIHPMPSNAYQSIPTNQPVQAQTYGYRPNQASPAYIPTNIPIRTPQGTVVNVPFFKQVQANVENPAALEASTYNQPLPQNPQPFQQPQQQFVHHQQQQQPPHQPQYQPQSMMNRPHPLPQPVQDQFFGTIQHPPPCNNLKSQVASKMAQFVAEHKENVPKKANPSEPIKFELEVDSKGNIKGHGMTMSGETIYFPETEAPPSTEPQLPPLQHPQQYPQRQQLQHPQQQSQYPQQYPQQQQQQQQSQYPQQYPQQQQPQQQLQNPQQYSQQQPQQQQSQYPQQYSQQQPQQQQLQYPQQQQQQLQYSQQYPQQQQQQQLQYPQQYPQQQQSLQYPQQPQQPQIPSAQRPDWQPVRHYPY